VYDIYNISEQNSSYTPGSNSKQGGWSPAVSPFSKSKSGSDLAQFRKCPPPGVAWSNSASILGNSNSEPYCINTVPALTDQTPHSCENAVHNNSPQCQRGRVRILIALPVNYIYIDKKIKAGTCTCTKKSMPVFAFALALWRMHCHRGSIRDGIGNRKNTLLLLRKREYICYNIYSLLCIYTRYDMHA
jgi:hypothetical protein